MYTWQEKKININEESKILIGLGDSFTQGHGACDIKIWDKYKWDDKKMYEEYFHDVVESGFNNSWVNQLCKNHLTDFIPINFGLSGRGNRACWGKLKWFKMVKDMNSKLLTSHSQVFATISAMLFL